MPSQLKQQLATKLHNYGSSNTINLDPITYNSRYPGFDQANYRKLESKADNLGLTGYQREQFMDNLYQQVLPEVQKQIKNSDRRKYINDANYEISQIQDKDAQIQAKSKLAVTEISQKLKEKYNIDPSINDEQIFNDWVKSIPNGNQLFTNYLNKGDTELLEKGGLGGNEVDNDSYAKIESKINGALKGDWGRLSTNGLKYVQGWKLILDATELAKAKGATGMSDGEIMRNVIKSSPKLQQKIAELQTIQKGLTDSDKSVLKGETNGVTVGRSGFSILPGISLQLGDDTGMNISLVNDKPASYKDIQDLIDVKEKFGDNYVGEVGNVAKVFANQPIDTLKKKGNQILNEFDNIGTNMENFWNNIMPKQVVEAMQGRELTDEEFEQFKQSRADEYDARKNKNKEQVLKYNDKINKAFQKQVEQNLDPQIKEYYDDKTMTELLALGDMKGVGYKQAQMVASNWDMLPNIVVTAVNTPAGLTMMFGDSYARESQDSFERLMNAGADYDQASGISKVVGVINGAVEVGLDRLLGGVETTASKNLKNAFMNNLTEEATKKGFWEILGNIAKKQAGSSLEEGAEEVIQEIVSNAAEMTIKDNPEFADLFKGTWEAFEGGVFNPMNLMAGGSDIAANKGNIQQSLLDASYDAGVTARNIVDAGSNMQNNLREFMLDGAYNAGKGARNIVEWADKVREFMSRKKGQNVTTEGKSESVWQKVVDTATRSIPEKVVENDLKLTPTERKNVERYGITPANFVLNERIAGLSNADKVVALQDISSDAYNNVTNIFKNVIPQDYRTESKTAGKMLQTMIETMEKSDIVKEEYADYIAKLKEMKDYQTFSPYEKLAIRRDFDAIVGNDIFGANGRVKGLEDQTIAKWRADLNEEINQLGEEFGIDVKSENSRIANAITIRDGLLRALSQNKKNNAIGLQDLGIGAILSAGNPVQAGGIIIAKRLLENAAGNIAQGIYNMNNAPLERANTKRGAGFIQKSNPNAGNNFMISSASSDNSVNTQEELVTEDIDVGANPLDTIPDKNVGANPTDLTATEEVMEEEVTTTPKKKTTKKKTSKKQTKNNVKLDTKKIASDYMKGKMTSNIYQHMAGLTEEEALEKRWKFQEAVDEEWDKNQDYYNTHQSELVEKFHHLLK